MTVCPKLDAPSACVPVAGWCLAGYCTTYLSFSWGASSTSTTTSRHSSSRPCSQVSRQTLLPSIGNSFFIAAHFYSLILIVIIYNSLFIATCYYSMLRIIIHYESLLLCYFGEFAHHPWSSFVTSGVILDYVLESLPSMLPSQLRSSTYVFLTGTVLAILAYRWEERSVAIYCELFRRFKFRRTVLLCLGSLSPGGRWWGSFHDAVW